MKKLKWFGILLICVGLVFIGLDYNTLLLHKVNYGLGADISMILLEICFIYLGNNK